MNEYGVLSVSSVRRVHMSEMNKGVYGDREGETGGSGLKKMEGGIAEGNEERKMERGRQKWGQRGRRNQ